MLLSSPDAVYLDSPSRRVIFPRVEVYSQIQLALGPKFPEYGQLCPRRSWARLEEPAPLHIQQAGRDSYPPVSPPVQTLEPMPEGPVESPVALPVSSLKPSPAQPPAASLPRFSSDLAPGRLTCSSTPGSSLPVALPGNPRVSPWQQVQPSRVLLHTFASARPSAGPVPPMSFRHCPSGSPARPPVEMLGPEQLQGIDLSAFSRALLIALNLSGLPAITAGYHKGAARLTFEAY